MVYIKKGEQLRTRTECYFPLVDVLIMVIFTEVKWRESGIINMD